MTKGRAWKVVVRLIAVLVGLFIAATAVLVTAGLRSVPRPSDIALVLGNKVELDGTPSARLRARLEKTLELYQAGYFPRVLVSGGVGKEGFDEGIVMRDYLVARGVPAEKVVVDSQGRTTYDSARRTAELMKTEKLSSVLVISQYFHLPRAELALRRFGVADVSAAHPHFFEARDLYSAPREVVGYAEYWWRK